MKTTECYDLNVEEDDPRVRCPECGVIWYDPADLRREGKLCVPKHTCQHLRFTLILVSLEEDAYTLKIHGKWDSKSFAASIGTAFDRNNGGWRKRLRRIDCPDVEEVSFFDDELMGCWCNPIGFYVYAFGFVRQKNCRARPVANAPSLKPAGSSRGGKNEHLPPR